MIESLGFFSGTVFPNLVRWLLNTPLGDTGISIGIFILSCSILGTLIVAALLRPKRR